MKFRFYCPSCGQRLKAEEEHAGRAVDCPHCSAEFSVPQPEPELPSSPTEPPRDRAFTSPNLDGALTCPVCRLRFDTGDIMDLAVHDYALTPEAKPHEQWALIYYDNASEHFQPGGGAGFCVNAVDKERLKDSVGPSRRFPFGLRRTDNATATRASPKTTPAKPNRRRVGDTELHFLGIQISKINETGRSGFVTTNSASDAPPGR